MLVLCCVSLSSAAGYKAQELPRQTLHSHLGLLYVPSRPGKLCTLTWVCSCPLQAWPKTSLALLSSCCLLCSPGPLSSPSHVPCGSWPAEECHVLLTGHSPSCPGEQLGVLLQELTLLPQLFEPYPLLPKHSFTKRSQNCTSHAD